MENKRDLEENVLRRSQAVEFESTDTEEERKLSFPFSSEFGVMRYFGNEVLEHTERSVDLSRLQNEAPLLWNHDPDRVLGVVRGAKVGKDKRAYADVEFSRNEFATQVWDDIQRGILRNVSVGYQINDLEQRGDDFVATSWMPYEVSIVSIPSDFANVGVGRSLDDLITATSTPDVEKASNMPEEERSLNVSASSDAPQPTLIEESMTATPEKMEVVRSEVDTQRVIKAERSRIQEIQTVASKYNLQDLGNQYIKEERSVADFNSAVLKEWKPEAITPKADETDIGLTPKETRSWSVLRAIDYLADPNNPAKREAAAFEIEASQAAAAKLGRSSRGITIPNEVFRRDLKTTPDTQGGNLVQTDLDSANFIDLLRNNSVLQQTGATTLTGLQGNLSIPRLGGAGTAYWVAESGAVTESQQTIEQVNLSPRSLGAMTDISRKLLIQSSIDVENMVRNDLAQVIALEIDRAALYGLGSASEPLGLHNTTGISTENVGNDDPSFGDVVNMESDIAVSNALTGSLAYVTRANIAGAMKVKTKDSGSGRFVNEDGVVNGYPLYVSNQVESGDIWYGNWSDLIIGYWSGLDLQVDPYTGGASGTVRVRVLQDVDVAVKHAASFCLGA